MVVAPDPEVVDAADSVPEVAVVAEDSVPEEVMLVVLVVSVPLVVLLSAHPACAGYCSSDRKLVSRNPSVNVRRVDRINIPGVHLRP